MLDPQILSTLLQLSAPGYNRAIGSGDVVPYQQQAQQGGASGAGAATPGASYDPEPVAGGPTGSIGAGGNSFLNNLSAITPALNQMFQNQQDASIVSGQANAMANPLPGAAAGPGSTDMAQQIAAQAGGVPIAGSGGVPGISVAPSGGRPTNTSGGGDGGPAGAPGDASGGGAGPAAGSDSSSGVGTGGGVAGAGIGEGEGAPGGSGAPGGAPGGAVGDGTAGGIGGSAPGGEGGAPGNSGEGGAGGGAGAGAGTVICTELRRQGLMDDATWAADGAFGRSLPLEVLAGYRLWAAPLARKMAMSPRLTALVASIALPWAQEMAYRMGASPRGSRVGQIVMAIGRPACAVLGYVIARRIPSIKSV